MLKKEIRSHGSTYILQSGGPPLTINLCTTKGAHLSKGSTYVVWPTSQFERWAPFVEHKLMLLRGGHPFSKEVDVFERWAPYVVNKLMFLRGGHSILLHKLMLLRDGPNGERWVPL